MMTNFLSSIPAKFLVPLLLLTLKFGLKLCVDRKPNAFDLLKGTLDIPIDIFFVNFSLLSAVIIIGQGDIQQAFLLCLTNLVVLVASFILWRRSIDNFDKENYKYTFLCVFINFLISVPALIFIINFLASNYK